MVSRAPSARRTAHPERLLAELRAALALHGVKLPSLRADVDASPRRPLINLGCINTDTAARLARVLREAAR